MKSLRLWLMLITILSLVACAVVPTPTPIPTQPPPTTTPGAPGLFQVRLPRITAGRLQPEITYCKAGDLELKMDVFYPDVFKDSAAPLAIHLHGGFTGKNNIELEVVDELLKRGYVVAAPNWRQPLGTKLPVGLGDAKCAVRHLRANAAVYHIDPNRVGAWGCSWGGTAAAMLGLTDAIAGLEGTGGYSDESSRVQAVVTRDGTANFGTELLPQDPPDFIGVATLDDPLISKISPVTYISKDAPPFLIFQSALDSVSRIQNQELSDKLKAANVPFTVVEVADADHCQSVGQPTTAERAKMIADFFDANLK